METLGNGILIHILRFARHICCSISGTQKHVSNVMQCLFREKAERKQMERVGKSIGGVTIQKDENDTSSIVLEAFFTSKLQGQKVACES